MTLEYTFNKVLNLCLLVLLFSVNLLLAQGSGSIRGTIYDKITKDELPGANVIIKGTSIGAATDLDGKFILRNVPAGEHTLVASYMGYESESVVITVICNKILDQNFRLSPTIVEGEEVVITAQAQGQIEAIQQQLTSDKIANVVSEARIQELPDFNAAQTISRLPGVSTLQSSGEANKIVIRGLAPKYNQITIGGVSLASTGSTQIGISSQGGTAGSLNNDRSVDLSMMSSYMIKTVSVYKSLTPDMNANAIGGVVNMELREAPSELHTDVLWQSGYTQKSNTYGNYRLVGSVSTRFFEDDLGVYLLGSLENYDRDADNMDAGYQITSDKVGDNGYLPVRVTQVTLNRHFETRKRYSGNLILDYRIPSGSIKMVNMFSRLNSNYQEYRTIYDYAGQTNDLLFRYREGDNNVDLAINSLEFMYDLDFMSINLKATNNYSRNNLPDAPQSEFFQTRGVNSSTPNTTPEDLTSLIRYGGTDVTYLNTLTLFSSDYKENGQKFRGDFKVPFNFGTDIIGYLKAGGQYDYTVHKNAQNTPYASIGGTNTIQSAIVNGIRERHPELIYNSGLNLFPSTSFTTTNKDILNSFLDDRFGGILWGNNPDLLTDIIHYVASNPQFSSYNATATEPGGWFDGYFQTLPNRYKYIEKYSAGYMMSELNYEDLMVVGGVRYEKVNGEYQAYNLKDGRDTKSQQFFEVNASPENEFWLPMVQARYNVTDWLDIRAAYTQSLARPDYHQLTPHFNISYSSGQVWAGNPNLKPAQAYNHDLIFTLHSNELGLFSVGGFYKEIKNFTYSTQYPLYDTAPEGIYTINDFEIGGSRPARGATLYTYINTPYVAYVRGVEIDLQTRFWYLPFPFNGVLLGVNYSHISSSATYPWRNPRTTIIPPRTTITQVFDSTRTGRLINQPNDILNAYIGYDYEGFSARLSFLFQGNAVSYVGNFSEQDGFTRDYFRIDASVRQVLPWFGIEVYLDLNNLNNETNTSAQKSIGGFTNEQNYGLTGNVGVRYRL
ncbi:MAG: TonB-dependent receptor [Ignavibacteriaceae bacterium]|nr:TonB-dependent receptor [Ignavibacteriaceae bacterium]